MTKAYALSIDGKAVAAAAHFAVPNPATGATVALCPIASLAQLKDAVAAARAAFPAWAATPDAARKAAIGKMADIIEAHADELAQLITLEQGKTLEGFGAKWEVGGAIAWARHTAGLDLPVEILAEGVTLHRRPIGVVGSITPWNYPLMIAIWHIMPAIRAGNTVVLKPSPNTPIATLRMGELLQVALPPGVLNVVAGHNDIGQAMADHPGIDKIVFTGSTATGRRIMASSSTSLKRLTLELGGNDAAILLPDTDVDAAIEPLFWGAFLNNGQTCACIKRLYVHDSIHDAVCTGLATYARRVVTGDGMNAESGLGAIQNRMQLDRIAALVDAARADGARVLSGGTPGPGPGLFYPATIVAEAKDGMAIVDEEQFGPALPIIRYADVEDAIARANRGPNGLGGSVWSSDADKARAIGERLECGSVWINNHGAIRPDAPFGGIKQSGFGVEFAALGLAEMTTVQVIHG